MVHLLRSQDQNDDSNDILQCILLCITECILSLLEDIIEYVNKWAYVYVGVYGYSYLEAAKSVKELFEAKGLTTIITDDITSYALSMLMLVDAILTGFFGVAIGHTDTLVSDFIVAFII